MRAVFPVAMFALLSVFVVTATAQDGTLRAESDAGGWLISEGERPVLYYQRTATNLNGKWPRAGYVHPLHSLDGQVITEDFPEDHRHHRGIFWAWHQVWLGEKRLGDSWLCRDFVWDVQSVEVTSPSSPLNLMATVHWKSSQHTDQNGRMIPVVQEQARITVHRSQADHRIIDFDVSLRALVDGIRIGGSEDVKGYGGFSPRIKLTGKQKFVASTGTLEPTKTAIEAGRWVNVVADQWGLFIIAHEDNPLPNQQWILRSRRSMQNAVYPGREPVLLSTDQPTRLRYRLVVHDGSLGKDKIEQLSQ